MRHQKSFRKFSRSSAHRQAMFRNLATSLLREERLETTVAKAKDLRRVAEKLITMAGKDTLPARRRAYSYLYSKEVVHKLFTDIGPRYKDRPGGYTRVVRTRRRDSDAAELAIIELVEEKKKKGKKSASGASRKRKASSESAPKKDKAAADTPQSAETASGDKSTGKAKKKAASKRSDTKKSASKKSASEKAKKSTSKKESTEK